MVLKGLLSKKSKEASESTGNAALQELVNYIKSVMPEADKKGFAPIP